MILILILHQLKTTGWVQDSRTQHWAMKWMLSLACRIYAQSALIRGCPESRAATFSRMAKSLSQIAPAQLPFNFLTWHSAIQENSLLHLSHSNGRQSKTRNTSFIRALRLSFKPNCNPAVEIPLATQWHPVSRSNPFKTNQQTNKLLSNLKESDGKFNVLQKITSFE